MAHMHYKGTGKVHSFRGLLVDQAQNEIRIQGPVGAIAWRITKFEIMPELPGASYSESIVQIWREEQTSASSTINFDNDELLAAAFVAADTQAHAYYSTPTIIFDNALFSRNIWVTNQELQGTNTNYYIELEEVKVSAAGMAQLAVAAARRTID